MKRRRHTKRRKAVARSESSSSVSEAMQTGKASPAAKKLRAYAQAMGPYAAGLRSYFDRVFYANNLRPYVDKVRPYIDKLHRHAVIGVDAVGSWLHRGIV